MLEEPLETELVEDDEPLETEILPPDRGLGSIVALWNDPERKHLVIAGGVAIFFAVLVGLGALMPRPTGPIYSRAPT